MSNTVKPPLSEASRELLSRDLPPSLISTDLRHGREFDYIRASTAITLANHAFGIGGWSTRVLDLQPVRNNQDRVIGYSATVRVTVHENGAQYEDVGTNALNRSDWDDHAEGGNNSDMTAHDIARKGAVSDALKRCLRYLGPLMGNNLYESPGERARVANEALDRLEQLIGKQNAEEFVFGPQYQNTNEVPVHASLRAIFSDPPAPTPTTVSDDQPAIQS